MPLPRCLPAQPVKRTVLLPQPLCRRGAQYTRTSHRSGGRRACTTVLQYTQAVLRQKKLRAGRRRYGRMAGRKQCFSRPRVFHGKETSRRLYTLCGIDRRALLPHKSVMHIRLVRKAYAPPPQVTAWQRHGSHNIPGHAVRRRTRAVPLYACRAGNCLPNSGKHPFRRSLPFGPYREERRLRIQQKHRLTLRTPCLQVQRTDQCSAHRPAACGRASHSGSPSGGAMQAGASAAPSALCQQKPVKRFPRRPAPNPPAQASSMCAARHFPARPACPPP